MSTCSVEQLHAEEKRTRLEGDVIANTNALLAIVSPLLETRDMETAKDQIISLSKKRGLLKQSFSSMLQHAYDNILGFPDNEQVDFLEILRGVTEGKIYMEIERTRITKKLSEIHERQGQTSKAASLMHELPVETFGSLEKREKIEFILEQIRLALGLGLYEKARLLSRKLTPKSFENPDFEFLKRTYLEMMIKISSHENLFSDCCKHFDSLSNLQSVQHDKELKSGYKKLAVLFALLSSYSNTQHEQLHLLIRDNYFDDEPLYKELLRVFSTDELIRWELANEVLKKELMLFPEFIDSVPLKMNDLRERVVEHNLRVISKDYSNISVAKAATLLDLDQQSAEDQISKATSYGMIHARIDRSLGLVTFGMKKSADEQLNCWNAKVESLLSIIIDANHKISKEEIANTQLCK